ncbi:MAG: sodium:proton antiporter [Eubacteriales bacterium]|nr:sodium:proton antiporter [Eubacteriales bacterium]
MQGDIMLLLPVLLPFAAAPIAYALGRKGKLRSVAALCLTVGVCFPALAALPFLAARGVPFEVSVPGVCGFGIALRADGFRGLYAAIAGLMWLFTSVFSLEYFKHEENVPRYVFFTLMTFGSTLGVLLSDNLITTFLFFEIMSLVSYPWVAHAETPKALRAAETYLYIALIGGLCILMGLFLLPQTLVTASFAELPALTAQTAPATLWLPCGLMLIGFGAKAGAFPLHVWLPKAHPVAPAPASALLSGMLTKTGIFGVLVLSVKLMYFSAAWGALLFGLGIATMLTGAVLALLSNDLKRVLASSSVSQIGFILIGVGLMTLLAEENGLAAWGTVGQMVNHSLFKLILFLCAGIVAMNAHVIDLDGARGFGRNKPLLHIVFLSGLLGISGVPLFSGYVSKSLLHESLNEYIALLTLQGADASAYAAAEWLFVIAGGLTLAYMLKIYVCIFWQHHPTRQAEYDGMKRYLSPASAAVLVLIAMLPPLLGMLPDALMGGIGRISQGFLGAINLRPMDVFSTENLLGACKSLVIGIALYAVLVRPLLSPRTADGYHAYPDRKPVWLDLEDSVYRPLLNFLIIVGLAIARALERSTDALLAALRRALLHIGASRTPVPGGNRFTYAVGTVLDAFVKLLNYTLWRKRPVQQSFVYALAAGNEEVGRQSRRLARSVSFSLLMFCLGLFATIVYLIFFKS